MRYQRARIVMASPPQVVFQFIGDLSRLPTWHWLIGSTTATKQRPKVGLEVAVRTKFGQKGTVKILALQPNERIALEIKFGFVQLDEEVAVARADGGTTVVYTTAPKADGFFGGLSLALGQFGSADKVAREGLV